MKQSNESHPKTPCCLVNVFTLLRKSLILPPLLFRFEVLTLKEFPLVIFAVALRILTMCQTVLYQKYVREVSSTRGDILFLYATFRNIS